MDYDLIVIGGGAAGLGAARAGVRRGAKTLLVSDGPPGGDCTFTGCVPSKTLIEAARRGLPFPQATQRVRDAVATIAATENAEVLQGEGIDVMLGRAAFDGRGRVIVDGRSVIGRRFIVATGSRPAIPPIPGLEKVPYLTNETVFDLPALPASLAVLGGGAIGCELAQAFARLGSRVTVVEAANRLLPGEEPEVSAVISDVFTREREGIAIYTGARVEKVLGAASGVRLELAGGIHIDAEYLLVATGRQPVTDELGLDAIGVGLDVRGHVITDDRLAITAPGMYAAGDVTGRMMFTHAADEMGRLAAGNALAPSWRRRRYRTNVTPWVTFTDPEIARVGLIEADTAARGGRVAYLPMSGADRAIAAGETDGFIKLLAGPRPLLRNLGGGRILGATIVAERAGEMIAEVALAAATGMFTGRLAAASHAYPTWSSAVQLAAAQFFGRYSGRTARPARPD